AAAWWRAVCIGSTHRRGSQVGGVWTVCGLTDALLEAAWRATRGETSQVRAAAETLRAQHTRAARALVPAGGRLDALLARIDAAVDELKPLGGGLGILRELTARTIDYLVARGERLSALVFA